MTMLTGLIANWKKDEIPLWQGYANELFISVESGIKKISPPLPLPIQELSDLIAAGKKQYAQLKESKENVEENRITFEKTISAIKDNLDKLKDQDLGNIRVNEFIFNARRAFMIHDSYLLSRNLNYAESFLFSKLSMVEDSQASGSLILNQFGVKNWYATFEKDVINILKMQVDKMSSSEFILLSEKEKGPALFKKLFLENPVLGLNKYESLSSSHSLDNPKDALNYAAEQNYGKAYEFYYMHVVTLIDALKVIEMNALLLSKDPKDPKERAEIRNKLLIETGMYELSTPESVGFLKEISESLGFKNTEDLYKNYKKLKSAEPKDALEELQINKNAFMKNAHSTSKNDPMEKIKKTAFKEFKRVKKRMKSKEFTNDSFSYATVIACCVDLNAGVDWIQKSKINIGNLGIDLLFPQQTQAPASGGYISMWRRAMNAAEYYGWLTQPKALLKDKIKEQLNSRLIAPGIEDQLFEGHLKEILNPVNQQFKSLISNTTSENRRELLKLGEEKIIAEYVRRLEELERISRPRGSMEASGAWFEEFNNNQRKVFEIEMVLSNWVNTELLKGDQLDSYLSAKEKELIELNEKIKKDTDKIESLKQKIPAKGSEKEKSKTAKLMDSILLKDSEKQAIQQENQRKQLNNLETALINDKLRVDVYGKLIKSAETAKNVANNLNKKSIYSLFRQLKNVNRKLVSKRNEIDEFYQHHLLDQPEDFNKKLSNFQNEYEKLENEMNLVSTIALRKMNTQLNAEEAGKEFSPSEFEKLRVMPENPTEEDLMMTFQESRYLLLEMHKIQNQGNAFSLPYYFKTTVEVLNSIYLQKVKKSIDFLFEKNSIENIRDPFAFLQGKGIFPFVESLPVKDQEMLFEYIMEKTKQKFIVERATFKTNKNENFAELMLTFALGDNINAIYSEVQAGLKSAVRARSPELYEKLSADFAKVTEITYPTSCNSLEDLHRMDHILTQKREQASKMLGIAEQMSNTYNTSLWNLFGVVSEEDVRNSRALAETFCKDYDALSDHMVKLIERDDKELIESFAKLSQEERHAHAQACGLMIEKFQKNDPQNPLIRSLVKIRGELSGKIDLSIAITPPLEQIQTRSPKLDYSPKTPPEFIPGSPPRTPTLNPSSPPISESPRSSPGSSPRSSTGLSPGLSPGVSPSGFSSTSPRLSSSPKISSAFNSFKDRLKNLSIGDRKTNAEWEEIQTVINKIGNMEVRNAIFQKFKEIENTTPELDARKVLLRQFILVDICDTLKEKGIKDFKAIVESLDNILAKVPAAVSKKPTTPNSTKK